MRLFFVALLALLALPMSASALTLSWEGQAPFSCRFGEAGASYPCSSPLELKGLAPGEYTLFITGADGSSARQTFSIKPEAPAAPAAPARPPLVDGSAGGVTVLEATPLNPVDIPPARMVTWGGKQESKVPARQQLVAAAGALPPLPAGLAFWALFGIAASAALGWFFYRPA